LTAGDRLSLELSLIRSMLAFVADSQRIFRTKLKREETREKVGKLLNGFNHLKILRLNENGPAFSWNWIMFVWLYSNCSICSVCSFSSNLRGQIHQGNRIDHLF